MTDQTFTNDNGSQGTTSSSFTTTTDQGTDSGLDLGSKLQQQMDVMQKRIGDKDNFIDTLKGENQTLREKMADIDARLESMGSVEDALARIGEAKKSNQDTTLDEETLVSKVLGKMQAKSDSEKADANFQMVSATLTKTYGADQVDTIVRKAAAENGLTFDDMFALAKKSPKALYSMVGIKQSSSASNPSQSTNVGYNSDNQNRDQKLADFSKLRRENPKEFYKPEMQKQFRELCLNK